MVTFPCPVGQTTNCPTIDVTPNTNVYDGQFVYISATGFSPTGSIRAAFCSAPTSVTDPSCLNGNWESQNLTPTVVPVANQPADNNLTSLAYPVFSDQAGQGNDLIPAHDLVNTHGAVPGFNCDNIANPCELVVTFEAGQGASVGNGPTITTANSAVVPLAYAAAASGCPTSDPQVQVESSFSLEHFLPAAVEATCTGPNGVVALNTSNDDTSVMNDFASGGSAVSFVDNAQDPNQLAALLGKQYAFVPVALSGTTESFLAGASNQGQNFPINRYQLTPNMVTGLITSLYQSPLGNISFHPLGYTLADNLVQTLANATPSLTCAQLAGCPATGSPTSQLGYLQRYDAFDMLNPFPAGYFGPNTFGSFNSNVASGSSYQATQWLCNASNTPFTVAVAETGKTQPINVSLTDTNTAPTTLTTAPVGSSIWGPSLGAWVFPNCHGYSNFPALSATANNYGPAQAPSFQARAMRHWCYGDTVLPKPPSPQQPCAAFGLMDTSEAQYYGLSTASLQNAAGHFVAPTTSSLEAAAGDFTPCPADNGTCPLGTFRINYADTNPAAYPMANITYAVIPTSTMAYAQGTAVKTLLTNLVTYAHGTTLPAGYAPLPDAIYLAALNDINTEISVAPAPAATGATSGKSGSGSGSTSTSGSYSGTSTALGYGSASTTPGASTDVALSQLPLTVDTSSTTPGGTVSPAHSTTSRPAVPAADLPTGSLLVGLAATTRYLLPAIVLVAIGALLGGLLLLFGPGAVARRRGDPGQAP